MKTDTNNKNEVTGAADGSELDKSSFYRKKDTFDKENPGNREEGSPKDINDPFFGTGSDSKNIPDNARPVDEETAFNHKDYNASHNSAGSHSSTQKEED